MRRNKRHAAKKHFLIVVLALLLCLSLFTVAGYAWFSDLLWSKASIETGYLELEVTAYQTEKTAPTSGGDPQAGSGIIASAVYLSEPVSGGVKGRLFDDWDWTSGSYNAKYIMVENTGNVAATYDMFLELKGDAELADYILLCSSKLDVGSAGDLAARLGAIPDFGVMVYTSISDLAPAGRVDLGYGTLAPGQAAFYRVDYYSPQDIPIPDDLALSTDFLVVASQDVADNTAQPAYVRDFDEFLAALQGSPGVNIVLLANIEIPEDYGDLVIAAPHNIDLNGYALKAPYGDILFKLKEGESCAIDIYNGTIWTQALSFDTPDIAVNLYALKLYTDTKATYIYAPSERKFHDSSSLYPYDDFEDPSASPPAPQDPPPPDGGIWWPGINNLGSDINNLTVSAGHEVIIYIKPGTVLQPIVIPSTDNPNHEPGGTVRVVAPYGGVKSNIIIIQNNTHDISFEGIDFVAGAGVSISSNALNTSDISLIDCTFYGNSIGTAIYNAGDCDGIVIRNCVFTDFGTAIFGGNAVSPGSVSDCTFYNCATKWNGNLTDGGGNTP